MLIQGGSLFTASRDSTIKRWGLKEEHTPVFEASYEGHCDWVNDIAFVEQYLASASSDGTVKLWHPLKKSCLLTLTSHVDYVSCLASAQHQSILTSAGLRSEIFMYDLEHDARAARKLFPSDEAAEKGSVYALVMDPEARVIAAGSTDAVIRLFDVREATKIMKLKGHTENIRCLAMNADRTRLLSGSSDHSIKLWDLRQQRCVQTFHVHSDSVWSILATDSFDTVISGGRDKCVFRTNLANRASELLFAEEEPIQYMIRGGSDHALWVATASSSITKWNLPGSLSGEFNMWTAMESTNRAIPGRAFLIAGTSSRRSSEVGMNLAPLQNRPSQIIRGLPAIVDHAVLNDQYRILTKDKDNSVALWDVTTGCEIEQYGNVDFQQKCEELHQYTSVPRWFSTDKRLGQLTLCLKYPQCYEAEFYAVDLGIDAPEDKRLNFGECMLRGLFGRWAMSSGLKYGDELDPIDVWGPGWTNRKKIKVPSFRFWDDARAKIYVSSVKRNGEPWKLSVREINEHVNDSGEIPEWIVDCVLRNRLPILRELKFSFHLLPYDKSVPPISQSRLNAPRVLQIRKVAVYLKQKLCDLDPPFPVHIVPFDVDPNESQADSEDTSSIPDEMDLDAPEVELLCNGEAVPFWMSLSAVHEYLWKSNQDLHIHYRVRTTTPAPAPQFMQPRH